MAKSHDNRSNGGGGFVFVEIFGIKLDLESVDSQKFLQVRKVRPKTNFNLVSIVNAVDTNLPLRNFRQRNI